MLKLPRFSSKDGLQRLRKSYKDNPEDSQNALDLARALEANKEFGEALSILQRVIDSGRADEGTYLLASSCFKGNSDAEGALSVLRQAEQKFPGSVAVKYSVGQALGALERYEEALQVQQEAVRLDDGSAEAHFRLGVTHATWARSKMR